MNFLMKKKLIRIKNGNDDDSSPFANIGENDDDSDSFGDFQSASDLIFFCKESR